MAYIAPSPRSTGTLITSTIWDQDVVANPIAIYAGAMSIASQAALDFVYAASATQLGRLAKTAGKYIRMNAGGTAYEFADAGAVLLVSYSTAAAAASILISSLDLATHEHYRITVHCEALSGSDRPEAKLNDAYIGTHYSHCAEVAATTEAHRSYSAANVWPLSGDANGRAFMITLDLAILTNDAAARPSGQWQTHGEIDTGGLVHAEGGGHGAGGTNLTSIRFLTNGGATANWKVWVQKMGIT